MADVGSDGQHLAIPYEDFKPLFVLVLAVKRQLIQGAVDPPIGARVGDAKVELDVVAVHEPLGEFVHTHSRILFGLHIADVGIAITGAPSVTQVVQGRVATKVPDGL